MAEGAFDYVIMGSTPLAGLVAGLLQSAHGKRICLVAEPHSPFRLSRSLDISVAPLTRAETLLLLKRLSAETLKLLGTLGKGLTERIDPLFIAELPATIAAHSHFRHQAVTLGHVVERLADKSIGPGAVFRVREVHRLLTGKIEPALAAWLDRLEVRRLDAREVTIIIRRDGAVRISHAGLEVEARHAILADDAAILAHLDEDERDRSLQTVPALTLSTEPAKPLHAPLMVYADRGVTVQQRGKSGLTALVTGDAMTAHARLGASLPTQGRLRRAGEAKFRTLVTTDGAALLGAARGIKATMLAGFGPTGAFLAPAIARMIAGKASEDEKSWFASREATRGNLRQNVAEFSAVPP